MTVQHHVALDLGGLSCPSPLIGARQIMADLAPGQVLMLISDCPGTLDDLAAWAALTGHELIASEKLAGKRVAYYLRKGRSEPARAHATLDIRGVSCPGPIVEAKRLLDALQPGEVLQLISNCPGAPADVRAWVKSAALELVSMRESARHTYEFFIRKK